MQCPKCASPMGIKDYDRFEIEYCTHCGGLWFQPDELEEVAFDGMRAVFALETGTAREGRKRNRITAAPCPECGTPMELERDREQPHILLDVCPEGHGVFLDAGEFTDLAQKTLWDRFKLRR